MPLRREARRPLLWISCPKGVALKGPMGRAGVIRDQAEIAIAMMRVRMTPDQAIALAYGAEIADVITDDIRAMTRRRKVTAARRLGRQAVP